MMRIALGYVNTETDVDAIAAYCQALAAALAEIADVDSACEILHADTSHIEADVLVIQYNPFAYGRRGYAPWLAALAHRLKRQTRDMTIALMCHETFVAPSDARFAVMRLWQRPQLRTLAQRADLLLASCDAWASQVSRLTGRRVATVPVGTNIPDRRIERARMRSVLGLSDREVVLTAFGTGHPSRLMGHVEHAALRCAAEGNVSTLINLGRGAPHIPSVPGLLVVAPGPLPAPELGAYLAASDIGLAPFVDGVSTRRTTAIAMLANELAVVGTAGPSTDAVFVRATAPPLSLTRGDIESFATGAAALAADSDRRGDIRQAGRAFFEQHFSWSSVAQRLVGQLQHG